jgi:leucyl-tRNA synthetase
VQVTPDITQDGALAAALAEPGIAKFVTGEPKKVIFVPKRLLNVVV